MRISVIALSAVIALSSVSAQAGWKDWFKSIVSNEDKQAAAALGQLSESKVVDGLRESLAIGTERTINLLGKPGGFLNSDLVRIPLPKELDKIAGPLRKAGQGKLVDTFESTLNIAAEKAVPHVASVFGDAIRELTLVDARGILQGEDDAATRFFERTASDNLAEKVLPIIEKATSDVGLTQQYKQLQSSLGPLMRLIRPDQVNLDQYVTNKALEGLFKQLEVEEKSIRSNPESRTTDLLRQVFSQ
jgi:hypothetical protein